MQLCCCCAHEAWQQQNQPELHQLGWCACTKLELCQVKEGVGNKPLRALQPCLLAGDGQFACGDHPVIQLDW